jgi:outer membrane protein assembly factor BamE (lipoprotein component of BamABCDE complex)
VQDFALAIVVAAAATAADADGFDKAKFMALKPGETKDEVIAAVGQPFDRWSADRVFIYRFTGADIEPGKPQLVVITVLFDKDDKLESVSAYSNQPKTTDQK